MNEKNIDGRDFFMNAKFENPSNRFTKIQSPTDVIMFNFIEIFLNGRNSCDLFFYTCICKCV